MTEVEGVVYILSTRLTMGKTTENDLLLALPVGPTTNMTPPTSMSVPETAITGAIASGDIPKVKLYRADFLETTDPRDTTACIEHVHQTTGWGYCPWTNAALHAVNTGDESMLHFLEESGCVVNQDDDPIVVLSYPANNREQGQRDDLRHERVDRVRRLLHDQFGFVLWRDTDPARTTDHGNTGVIDKPNRHCGPSIAEFEQENHLITDDCPLTGYTDSVRLNIPMSNNIHHTGSDDLFDARCKLGNSGVTMNVHWFVECYSDGEDDLWHFRI